MKLDEEGDGKGDEEDEEEMEEGGGLEIPVGTQGMVPVKTQESVEAKIRSGKTPEERQEEFKDMLLERGVCIIEGGELRNIMSSTKCEFGLLYFFLFLSRYLRSLPGTRSSPSLCLILATCCSTPRRERAVSRSSSDHEQRKREKRNAAS